MGNYYLRKIFVTLITLTTFAVAQNIPLKEPYLLPFPSAGIGLSYLSMIPGNNLQVAPSPRGWTENDTLRGIIGSLDLEILRYRWLHHFLPGTQHDAYTSLRYSISNLIGSFDLPPRYPSTFDVHGTEMSDYRLNILLQKFYLENQYVYNYSHRSSLHGILGTGFSRISLYNNGGGARLLNTSAFDISLGVGWKTTLVGRTGKRIRLGVDLGFSLRKFDLTEQDEDVLVSDGSSTSLSPIQSVSLNAPNLRVNLEFGEVLFSTYTPYRDPYKLGILNLSMGAGFISYSPGVSVHMDTTTSFIEIPMTGKISQSYDLQLFRYNWPFRFVKQANIDAFSGMGVRLWKTSKPATLPTGWAKKFTDGSAVFAAMTFAPRVLDIYIDHEVLYPLGPKIHTKFSAGTGYASMTLYENIQLERLIDASSITWHIGAGLGYSIKGDGSSRVLFGINLDYYHQAFDIDMSSSNLTSVTPGEIIPITFLDLSQPVISIDIGLIFGGQANAAYKAHKAFKKKQFSQALEMQQEILKLNPNHHNKAMILAEQKMVEDSLVTRYYKDVRTILSQGKLQSAFSLIQQGEAPPGEAVERAIADMKIEISDRSLEVAAEALKQLDYELAEELILLALKSDPSTYPVAKVLLARSYIIRATILYNSGVFKRSLYWLKQADGLSDRYADVTRDLRKKIGDGRLDDANEGILKEDRQMVYVSMQEAKSLNPNLSEIVDEHLHDLEQAIKQVDELKVAPLKRMALDNVLDDVDGLNPDNFKPKVGMKGSLISRYIGPPERQFKEGEYQLYVYPESEETEVWLYLRNGVIEKIEYQKK